VEDNKLKIDREIDGGMQSLELSLPSVVSCDLRINTPRFSPIPAIMKAKKKPLESLKDKDLGIDL